MPLKKSMNPQMKRVVEIFYDHYIMELVQTYISYNLVVNPKDNPIIGFLREGSGDGGDY